MQGVIDGNVGGIWVMSLTLNPVSVAANTTAEQTFTVQGLRVGDQVLAVNKPSATAGAGIVNHRVSAANTLAITFSNNTGSGIDPASEVYTVVIVRPDSTPVGGLPS